jgi:RNA polymerase sigma-70 factor, ECF subfamily
LADLPADDPDRALIRAAAGGDADAFEGFVRRYEQRIVSLAATIVGPQEAEDVAQEVFVRIYRALPTFRGDSAIRTWLSDRGECRPLVPIALVATCDGVG